jgi:hypothetical protein
MVKSRGLPGIQKADRHHFPPFFLDTAYSIPAIFEPLIRFNKRFHGTSAA